MNRTLLVYIFMVVASQAGAQGIISVNDHIRDYSRLLEIEGKAVNNPIVFFTNQTSVWEFDSIPSDSLGLWSNQLKYYQDRDDKGLNLYLLSPRVDYTYNSKYSRTYNDGPLWSGRGHTVGLNAGVKMKWGPVTGVLYPNFYHAQNKHFQRQSIDQTGSMQNELNYLLADFIDWVQIFGYSSFSEFDWGQSSIAVTAGPIELKFGNENMWWGPAVFNPIMMSNTAPGFPHLSLGTKAPQRTKYGDFEFNTIWGQLRESDYFELEPSEPKRYIVGVTFGYRPSFVDALKGLSFGFSRIIYQNWPDGGLSFKDAFLAFSISDNTPNFIPGIGLTNDESDQLLGFHTRWFFEEVGFETYFEWIRNDFWVNFEDLVMEPEHAGVTTLGFRKVFSGDKRTYQVGFEHTSLAATRTTEIRTSQSVYLHSVARQGFTHKGHLLGSGIGPGGKSQTIKADRIDKNGKYSFSINRIRFNDDYFFARYGPTGEFLRHDVEWNFGLEAVRFFKNYEFSGKFIYSRRMNWHYYYDLDVNNFQLLASVRYHIMSKPLLTLFDR